MCSEFHKAMRNQCSEEVQKATEARSIENLSRLMKGRKVTDFMEDVQQRLNDKRRSPDRRKTTNKFGTNTATIEDNLELKKISPSRDSLSGYRSSKQVLFKQSKKSCPKVV